MITVSQIRNGEGYMRNHLSCNDYYSENERITGQWHGKSARMLGLEGMNVTAETFEALRSNRHPGTGGKLTPRRPKVAFHDFVISAPKSVSIAAMVGDDERIVEAFDRCVLRAFQRLESHAAVRVRTGKYHGTEELRRTGNVVAAVFRHDTSRLLDPQLHTHLVFANMSWDEHSGRWLALQPKEMAEQSKVWIRGKFYRELAQECRALGYTVEKDGEAFRLSGIDRSIDYAFSQRAIQRDRFIERYRKLFGHQPDKKRVEHFIKDHKAAATRCFKKEYETQFGTSPTKVETDAFVQDWRSSKMARSTSEKVNALQQSRMSPEQAETIENTVNQARRVGQRTNREEQSAKQDIAKVQKQSYPENIVSNNYFQKLIQKANKASKGKPKNNLPHKKRARLKKAKDITAALRAHPVKLMAWRIQQLARKKHGTQRRIR